MNPKILWIENPWIDKRALRKWIDEMFRSLEKAKKENKEKFFLSKYKKGTFENIKQIEEHLKNESKRI